jgi:NADH-quinone oxidoreductase subunit J
MNVIFWIAALVAVVATGLVITRYSAIHALLYLTISLLAVSVIFVVLGAPFVAALEVIIYAGAIMVLFVFAIMLLNLGPHTLQEERRLFTPRMLIGPSLLALLLFGATLAALLLPKPLVGGGVTVSPAQVGLALYGPYLLGVELASMLLFAGVIGAYHLARQVPVGHPQPVPMTDAGRTPLSPGGTP